MSSFEFKEDERHCRYFFPISFVVTSTKRVKETFETFEDDMPDRAGAGKSVKTTKKVGDTPDQT